MRIVITTSDDYVHLLAGFAHQWNRYCGLIATIVYRNVPPPALPDNFILLPSPARYFEWSTSLKNALLTMDDDLILLGLDDYWLSGPVDQIALGNARDYMIGHPDVQRIDLTEDRSAYPHILRDGYVQAVIDPNEVQYVLSTQFSLWRRAFLIHALEALNPPGVPPQFEVEASRVVAREQPVILGTTKRVLPCHGDGVVWNGRTHDLHLEYLTREDAAELRELGYTT